MVTQFYLRTAPSGAFHVPTLKAVLADLPGVAVHPQAPHILLIGSSEDDVGVLVRQLVGQPVFPLPPVGIMRLSEREVAVSQETTPSVRERLRLPLSRLLQLPGVQVFDSDARPIIAPSREAMLRLLMDPDLD